MKIVRLITSIILGLFMIFAASGHITNPDMSSGFIPDFLPEKLVHVLTALVEAGLGVLTLIPKTRQLGLKGIFVLMILFLPIHIIDLFRASPVLGSVQAAIIRVVVQFVLILLPWFAMGKTLNRKLV